MYIFIFVGGLLAIIFHNNQAQNMVKHLPKELQAKWIIIGEWGYISIGILLCTIGILGILI
jgi:hypothetical protein